MSKRKAFFGKSFITGDKAVWQGQVVTVLAIKKRLAKIQAGEHCQEEVVSFDDLTPHIEQTPLKSKRRPGGVPFKKGYDERRHVFTQEEYMRGYHNALAAMGACSDYEAKRRLKTLMCKNDKRRSKVSTNL